MCYFSNVLEPDRRERLRVATLEALTPKLDLFDGILVRGMSGAVGGSLIAGWLGKKIVILRKASDVGAASHGSKIEWDCIDFPKRLLFVDDFIISGATLQGVLKDLPVFAKRISPNAQVVAFFTYHRPSVIPVGLKIDLPNWGVKAYY